MLIRRTAYSIRLASYNEVARAYPSDKALKRIAGMKLNDEEWQKELDKVQGELFKNEFFRVVLDEGHAIRNHNTRSLSHSTYPLFSPLDYADNYPFNSGKSVHQPVQQIQVDPQRHPYTQPH